MGHRSAGLTIFGRQLPIDRVETLGKPVAMVATEFGISRATGYKWVSRYRAEGEGGLADRSSGPRRSPRALPREQVEAILSARVASHYGPHRLAYLTGHPRSTISDVLARAGMNRLDQADKLTGAPVRYVACHPGALLHQDHKKLGRIPDGGGHRVLGPSGASQRRADQGQGYDHFEVFVDDASRLGFVALVDDERRASAVDALERAATFYAERGIHIERLLTDDGAAYRSRAYATQLAQLGIRHKRTRPYRPQTNGKAERFIKTLLAEWAYARPYDSNDELLLALPGWLRFYNEARPPHRPRRTRAARGPCQQPRRESHLGTSYGAVVTQADVLEGGGYRVPHSTRMSREWSAGTCPTAARCHRGGCLELDVTPWFHHGAGYIPAGSPSLAS